MDEGAATESSVTEETAGADDNGEAAAEGTADDEATASTEASSSPTTSDSEAATDTDATASTEDTEAASEDASTSGETAEDPVETADAASMAPMADGPIAAADAGIQVLHGVPGAKVDVYVNGSAIATGFESGTIAGPIAMEPGNYEIELYPATDLPPANSTDRSDDALFSQIVPVTGSAASIVAHLDPNGEVTISPFLEQLNAVDPGEGRLMIRHLMAGGDAEATVDGVVVGSLAPGEEAAVDVSAGSVEVAIVGGDGSVLASATVAVDDGELVALSAIGAPGGSGELVVQRYSGLATAPSSVPTGDSGLLGGGSDELGIRLSYGLMAVFTLSGALVFFRRRRTAH